MEADLLRGMIADREQRIALVEAKMEEQKIKERRLCEELETVSLQNQNSKIQIQTERTRLFHEFTKMREHLEQRQRDLRQQGSSLSTYAGVIKQEDIGDTGYVMRMQAQLCKAMHSMGIIDHQHELAKAHAEALLKLQRDRIASINDERSQVELQVMNELVKMDTVTRGIENEYSSKLDEIRHEVDAIEKKLEDEEEEEDDHEKESSNKEDDDEDEDGEEDEEEKKEKEELLKILQQKRDQIDLLAKQTQEQIEHIRKMEGRFREVKGESISISNSNGALSHSKAADTDQPATDSKSENSDKPKRATGDSGGESFDAAALLSQARNRLTGGSEQVPQQTEDEDDDDEGDESPDDDEEVDDDDEHT